MLAGYIHAEPARVRFSRKANRNRWIAPMVLCAMCLPFFPGCGEVWTDPLSTAAEYEKGLVVMYPGALVSDSEMLGFWGTFRLAGVDQAIEVVQWTTPRSYEADAVAANQASRASAVFEAERLAEYIRAHPNSPVTLLGYSAGAMYALMVAEVMPADAPLDKLILLSSSVSHQYDLVPALDHTRGGAFAYWSPNENTLRLLIAILGTTDLTDDPAAGYTGFDTVDPRLTQLQWTPQMLIQYGQPGEHSAYIYNLGWIADYIVPNVPRTKP